MANFSIFQSFSFSFSRLSDIFLFFPKMALIVKYSWNKFLTLDENRQAALLRLVLVNSQNFVRKIILKTFQVCSNYKITNKILSDMFFILFIEKFWHLYSFFNLIFKSNWDTKKLPKLPKWQKLSNFKQWWSDGCLEMSSKYTSSIIRDSRKKHIFPQLLLR